MATTSRFLLRQPVGKGGRVVGVVVGGGRLGLGLESKQDKTKRTKQQEQDKTRLRQDKTRLRQDKTRLRQKQRLRRQHNKRTADETDQ